MLATAVVLSLSLAAGACSGDDGSPGSTGTPAGTGTPGSTLDPASAGELRVARDDLDGALSAALAEATRQGHAGISASGAVVGVRTPEGDWVATIGTASPGDPIPGTTVPGDAEPVTVDVHQRVGSVSKTFTVTLLLQLVEAGLVSVDDPIGDYVPGTTNPQATLGQLAAMRSGIPSYTTTDAFSDAFFADPFRSWRPEELVALVEGADPLFAPGAAWNYSNTNLVLLGMVVEQVSGRPVEELVAERIATPLGLTGTLMPTDAAFPDPHTDGFTVQGQDDRVPVETTDWNPSWAWTAGGMISTVDDLLTYGRSLVAGGVLLDPEMQAARLASMESMGEAAGPEHDYGWGLQRANGWWGHTGELPGYNTFMYHRLDEGLTVVVLVNSDIKSGDCEGDAIAATTPGGRTTGPCVDPAVHVADLVTAALGFPGNPVDLGAFGPTATR